MMEYICTQEEESREDTTTCITTTFEEAADGKLNLTLNCTTHFFISQYTIWKRNMKYLFKEFYIR